MLKSKLKQIICLLSFFSLIVSVSGQEVTISASADTLKNRIKTNVSLIDIPQGGRIRFQQRLPLQAKLIAPPVESLMWDTNNNIFTIIMTNYPDIDTLPFQFVCEMNSLPDTIIWGEVAFIYEDANKQVQIINIPPKRYIVRAPVIKSIALQKEANIIVIQKEIDSTVSQKEINSIVSQEEMDSTVPQKGMYYIQVLASNRPRNINDLSKIIHLQSGYKIIEQKTDVYRYYVGQFPTKEAALNKLNHYRQYIKGAFLVAF